jgi:hypothetical protein
MRLSTLPRTPPHSNVKSICRLAAMILAVGAVLGGCSRDISGAKPRPLVTADTSLLTAEVATALQDGKFALAGPDATDQVSEPQARAIARAWIREGLPYLVRRLEQQRGASIDKHGLRDCPRVYYGESPYEPLSDVSDAGVARRTYGPWWLVPLCAGGEPQVLLGIAAYATNIRLENGSIRLPKYAGAEFVWRSVPVGGDLPVPPEAAANEVARATGSKVASVPRLILPNFRDGSPAAARWSMSVRPAPAVGVNGRAVSRPTNLFLGPDGPGGYEVAALQRAAADQPNELRVQMWNFEARTVDHTAVLTRKPAIPVRFERVEGSTHD